MEQHSPRPTSKWPKVPSWTILVAVLGAMILAGIMFNRDYRREQGHLKEMFLQRGEVLIHSLEMVGRVRFGESWETAHLQTFWNNLEADDNVLFLALTDESGLPLALVGDLSPDPGVFRDPAPSSHGEGPISPNYRLGNIGGRKVFMVYRAFWPIPRPVLKNKQHHQSYQERTGRTEQGHSRRQSGQGPTTMGSPALSPPTVGQPVRREFPVRYLWVAFDLTPSEQDTRTRVRTAAIFIGLFCLSGLAGVLALIWGHNSRLARRLYQDTNALAAELIGRLPIGVILKNEQGRISLINQATMTISGLKEADFLGRSPAELTFGRFPTEETLAGREVTLGFKGGHSVRVALTCGPVISDDGHSLGQVILMEDLGELGRLKAELAKNERLATLGGLAAGLAHEIRNPLGAIRGLAQHLLSKTPAGLDREALEVMLASVDRLGSTITDFLDYARPTIIKTAPLDLVELLRNLTILAGHDARSQAVEISLDLPERPVNIEGDEALLSQAFLNIYINAIESAGGRAGGGGRLNVTLTDQDQRAVLTFHDNGPGFNPDQLAQPFVPYFTTKAEGTGLGLALVEKTVRAHEGADIALGAPPSGGGLVTVSFRLIPESENHESSPETTDIDS